MKPTDIKTIREIERARRKSNLKQWIKDQHNDNQAKFLETLKEHMNQGELSALINKPDKSFGYSKARRLEEISDIPNGWLDSVDGQIPTEIKYEAVASFDERESIPNGWFAVKEYDIRLSCGNGNDIEYDEIDTKPRLYHESFFLSHNATPDDIVRFGAEGDSMKPLIKHGYKIAVNTKNKDIPIISPDKAADTDNMVVMALLDDRTRKNKYVYIDSETNELVLHSLNPAFKDERYSAEYANEYIHIIGRVVDQSGDPNA